MLGFEYSFPSIRGIQAGREYYVSMCPLRLIPRIFLYDEEELKPELRAQRTLNKQRIPELAKYISANPKDYTFSSLTASIDGKVRFEPISNGETESSIGTLHIPMSAQFVINDGQHRRAAIEAALQENPDLADETISVVFFLDVGLKRCQQMFADLNRHSVRPTTSLGVLYDHRDESSLIAKHVMNRVPVFNGLTETERSNISNRSIKLFTLSGIHNACQSLLRGAKAHNLDDKIQLAVDFWVAVSESIQDWQLAKERKVSASDLRRDYVHAHTLALVAIARAGNAIMCEAGTKQWRKRIAMLSSVNWLRDARHWRGRALVAGRLSKRSINVALTTNYLKRHLGIPLTEEERTIERDFKGRDGAKLK